MNCPDHKNEELAHCPSCLAGYWEMLYNEANEAKKRAYKEGMLRALKIVDDTRYLTREGTKEAIRAAIGDEK